MIEHICMNNVQLCLNGELVIQDISMSTGMKILLKGYLRIPLQGHNSSGHKVAYLQHST
jgi:hypothetical protein